MASQASHGSSGITPRAENLAASIVDGQHKQTTLSTQSMYVDGLQAAGVDHRASQSGKSLGNTVGSGVTARSESRCRPTLRLSQMQHTIPSGHSIPRAQTTKTSAGKYQYHEAISRKTEKSFNEQLARSFASPIQSREVAQGRPSSLAATHPALYNSNPSKTGIKPPVPMFMQSGKRMSVLSTQGPLSPPSNLTLPAAEAPWKSCADPMYQTSSDPQYWTNNRTILKVDANTEHGNVISPTWMVGLPLGSMTEMAEVYPHFDN